MGQKIKFTIIVGVIVIISIGLFLLKNGLITGQSIIERQTYTKAICDNSNFCQDYLITCENGNFISQSSITGAIIQHDDDWTDPRNDSEKEIKCR